MIVLFNTVYYNNWFLSDTILVGLHIAVVSVLTIPVMGVPYFMVMQYARYSLHDPRFNITSSDLSQDFWNLPFRVLELYPVGIAFFFIALFYIILNFFQEIILLYNSIFPEFRMFAVETK